MKNYVLREWTGNFKESIIVTDNVSELTVIKSGIELMLKNTQESLEFYRCRLKEADNDSDKLKYEERIKTQEEYLNMIEKMNIKCEVKNEIPIERYSIKKEKVNYAFDFNISELSDEEILEKLVSVFPDKELYMVPRFRDRLKKKVTVLGHKGNIVVTYK